MTPIKLFFIVSFALFLSVSAEATYQKQSSVPFTGATFFGRQIIGDFDTDGDADILYQTGGAGSDLNYIRSNGDGTFTTITGTGLAGTPFSHSSISATTNLIITDITIADFDGDGDLDIWLRDPNLYWKNVNGSSYEQQSSVPFTGAPFYGRQIVGDFDADGDADILYQTGGAGSDLNYIRSNGNGTFTTITGTGLAGTPFSHSSISATTNLIITDITIADFDGDGDLDIWLRDPNLYWKNVNGSSYEQQSSVPFTGAPFYGRQIIGDFDTDGDADILYQTGGAGSDLDYIRSNGNGTFTTFTGAGLAGTPFDDPGISATTDFLIDYVTIADFDADGRIDIWDRDHNTYYTQVSYVWTGASGTSWSTTTNWSTGAAPTSTGFVIIPGSLSNYPVVGSGTASCKYLTVRSGASLTVNGSGVLQVAGSINNSGTINASSGSIVLNGTELQAIQANTFSGNTVKNLTLSNSAGATLQGTLNVTDTYTPLSGTLTTNGFLVLKSSISSTARVAAGSSSGGYINGTVTVEKYVPGKRAFRFLTHPFTSSIGLSQLTDDIDITGSGGSANGFTTSGTNNPSAFWFDVTSADNSTAGNNPGWTAFTHTGGTGVNSWDRYELIRLLVRGSKGQGLSGNSYTADPITFEYAGTLNQGTQTITLTKGTNSGFVSCGNPFPCDIQMNQVTRGSNVGANYYLWDATSGIAGSYVTNPWSMSYVLPAYAAFFTTVSANSSNTITIEESDKASGGTGLFKSTGQDDWVELFIEDSSMRWDRLLIGLNDNGMAVEDGLDGIKLHNPGLDFFTISKDNVRLAVDVRPYKNDEIIPLGLTAYSRYNRYVIRVGLFNVPTWVKLYLKDTYLNKTTELKPGAEYWFDVTADSSSQGNQRFKINMTGQKHNTITDYHAPANMQITPNPAKLEVKVFYEKIEGQGLLRLVNMAGQVLFSQSINTATGSVIVPLHSVPKGIYIVEMLSANNRSIQKLVKE